MEKQNGRFTSEQIQTFRNLLNLKKASLTELEKDLEKGALSKPEDHTAEERVLPTDQGAEEMSREVSLRLAEGEVQEIKEINHALYRLANGGYGDCEECGIQIPIRRLEVLPETRFCVQCEELLEEAQEVQTSRGLEVDFDRPVIKPEI